MNICDYTNTHTVLSSVSILYSTVQNFHSIGSYRHHILVHNKINTFKTDKETILGSK